MFILQGLDAGATNHLEEIATPHGPPSGWRATAYNIARTEGHSNSAVECPLRVQTV
jgi:hypothetical protein